jgi:peptidoglycan glycosyltransferase
MGRRIQWLGVGLIVCFALVIAQLVNVQVVKAPALDTSPTNPRNQTGFDNIRGEILAANGTVLAESVPAPKGSGSYEYMRQYPGGSLYSGIVGYSSIEYGTAGIENFYNADLEPHSQPAKTINQLLSPPPPTTDDVTLTVEPFLQQTAETALSHIVSPNKDGAVVVLDPSTGAVLAMASTPSYTPNALANPTVKIQKTARFDDLLKDSETFYPARPLATWATILPGSTFKVVTTSAVYNLDAGLSNFTFPVAGCTTLPDSDKEVCNDAPTAAKANPCGGTITVMLPESCDPGYVKLGISLGAPKLSEEAELFGYNKRPPIDLTSTFVSVSRFPSVTEFSPTGKLGLAGLGYSAFGQQTVAATPLQQAMVAEGVADGGKVMSPHLMSSIHTSDGAPVEQYKPTVFSTVMTPPEAAHVTTLMEHVVTNGTAARVGFPSTLHAAVKTGTGQTGRSDPTTDTDDWMIGFAPATDPKVAVCVTVPFQPTTTSGAEVAGPIMKQVLEAALHATPGQ